MKKAKLLLIDNKNPMYTQLRHELGDSFNSNGELKEELFDNFSVTEHVGTGKVFVIYPKRIYDQLDEHAIADDFSFLKKMRDIEVVKAFEQGGKLPHEDKMFHLPLELVVYVPSTQDVDAVVSVDEMNIRINEVKSFLAKMFGGYTSSEKIGGYVTTTKELVNEHITQVVAFATVEDYNKHKEQLVQQISEWALRWGQEAIGLEFEGDLYYVPQKFEDGGEIIDKDIANTIISQLGGFNRLVMMTGAYNFVALKDGVAFRIKNPRANYIKVLLTPTDLYDLEVGRIRGDNYTVVKQESGLYNDMLKPSIEKATGMYLSLFEDGGEIGIDPIDRVKLAESGVAMSDGSFPIRNEQDLINAIKDQARTFVKVSPKHRQEIRQHIIDRANKLNIDVKLNEKRHVVLDRAN